MLLMFVCWAPSSCAQDLIVYAVMSVCDVGSFALVIVLGLVTLYYLILYKLQESVFFLMVDDGDMYNFR